MIFQKGLYLVDNKLNGGILRLSIELIEVWVGKGGGISKHFGVCRVRRLT